MITYDIFKDGGGQKLPKSRYTCTENFDVKNELQMRKFGLD